MRLTTLFVRCACALAASAPRRPHLLRCRATMATLDGPPVTSLQNPRVKAAQKLHRRRGRDKANRMLLEGHRLVCDAVEFALLRHSDGVELLPDVLFVGPEAFDVPEADRLAAVIRELPPERVVPASPEVLRAVATTETPQAVVAVMRRPQLPWPLACSLVLVLDGVRDPGNMGTLARSACATGVDGVLLLGGCADPWSPKALRSAMGATLRLPFAAVADWADARGLLGGLTVHAADAAGARLFHEVDWRQPSALVVGAEAAGLSPQVRRAISEGEVSSVTIPLAAGPDGDRVESLNAAVAGSVVLCEAFRQCASESATKLRESR